MEREKVQWRAVKVTQQWCHFFFWLTLSFFIYARQDQSGHYVMPGEVNVRVPPGTDRPEDVKMPIAASKIRI